MKRCADCALVALRHRKILWWEQKEYYCSLAGKGVFGPDIDLKASGQKERKRTENDYCPAFHPEEDPLKSHLEKCLEMEES